jgi:hypothetical protein
LKQITLTGGNAGAGNGGALLNRGTLIIQESTVRNSQAQRGGGIFAQTGSSLTVVRGIFTGNSAGITGGGIEVKRATASISTSTVSGNNAPVGGGVYNTLGTIVLWRTTVNNNTANAGAGVNNNRGTMSLINVTVSHNSASAGGGVGNSGVMTLSFVTLSGNSANIGGGIYHFGFDTSGTLAMSNTILNAGTPGQNCYVPAASATTITSTGHNISSDNSCTGFLTQTGDRNNTNPLLGSLVYNGGWNQTHWLASTSPALDQGQCVASVTVDQRGIARPQGAACDIGAVEVTQ